MESSMNRKRKLVEIDIEDFEFYLDAYGEKHYDTPTSEILHHYLQEQASIASEPSLDARYIGEYRARDTFGLKKTDNVSWGRIKNYTVPQYLRNEMNRLIKNTHPDHKGNKRFSRTAIDFIVLSALDKERTAPISGPTRLAAPVLSVPPLTLQYETDIQRSIVHRRSQRTLTGFVDCSIWYDNPKHSPLATNLIVVTANKEGWAGSCVGEVTAYMGSIHALRKEEGKENAIMYGVATDGLEYRFFRIDNDGDWSKSRVLDWDRHAGWIYSIFRTLIKIAALSTPSSVHINNPEQREMFREAFQSPSKAAKFDYGIGKLLIEDKEEADKEEEEENSGWEDIQRTSLSD